MAATGSGWSSGGTMTLSQGRPGTGRTVTRVCRVTLCRVPCPHPLATLQTRHRRTVTSVCCMPCQFAHTYPLATVVLSFNRCPNLRANAQKNCGLGNNDKGSRNRIASSPVPTSSKQQAGPQHRSDIEGIPETAATATAHRSQWSDNNHN